MQFVPSQLEVASGDTVVWTNEDLVPHSVTAEDKRFDSGSIVGRASWTYVTTKNDRIAYHCVFHPTMKGTLIVK